MKTLHGFLNMVMCYCSQCGLEMLSTAVSAAVDAGLLRACIATCESGASFMGAVDESRGQSQLLEFLYPGLLLCCRLSQSDVVLGAASKA